eukprot:gene14756-20804_t
MNSGTRREFIVNERCILVITLGAIHRAAGPELLEACREIPEIRPGVRCPTGESRITPGFDLDADYVIHTVGPIYTNPRDSAELLGNAFK